jgi:hypothetical protein
MTSLVGKSLESSKSKKFLSWLIIKKLLKFDVKEMTETVQLHDPACRHKALQEEFFRRRDLNPIKPDSLHQHSLRTAVIIDQLSALVPSRVAYDPDLARALALIHGDRKGDALDIPKRLNSQTNDLWIGDGRGYHYPRLLLLRYDPLYGRFAKYASSFDGLCFALYNVRFGNSDFLPVAQRYKAKLESDLTRPSFLKDIRDKHPSAPLFCLDIPDSLEPVALSRENLLTPTRIKPYDFWVNLVCNELDIEHLL